MEKGTVSISFVVEALEKIETPALREQILLSSGIPPPLLALSEVRVSSAVYASLMRNAAAALADEFLGHDSRRVKPGSFEMLCRSVVSCPTLGEAMQRAVDFYWLLLDDLRGELLLEKGIARLTLVTSSNNVPSIFAQEMLLMFLHRLACWLSNRRIPISSASFRYTRPSHATEYSTMFGREIYFDQPITSISISADSLSVPLRRSNAALSDFLAAAPENLLVRYRDPHSVSANIATRLAQIHPGEWPGFEALVEDLGYSESTARRRLEEEGGSYQSIKDHLRRDMAINLLSDTNRSVMEIASQLGFAEPSAFHRAFKKWTNATPGDYRRASGTSEPAKSQNAVLE